MNRKIKVSSIISMLFCLVFSVSTVAAGTTQYQYDDLHRLTRVERSDGTVTVYEFEYTGNGLSEASLFWHGIFMPTKYPGFNNRPWMIQAMSN